MNTIDTDLIHLCKKDLHKDNSYVALQHAVTANGIFAAFNNIYAGATNTTVFSDELESSKVTDQKESGRCWLFAALNILRYEISKNYKMKDFELSQSYSFFWDKLEKSNVFYEQMMALADQSLDDRQLTHWLHRPQPDGGWWEGAAALIDKYGVVPKYVMPDPITMEKTREINLVLNRKLRKDALILRRLSSEPDAEQKLKSAKQKMLSEVYKLLVIAFGEPPETFDFAYKDTDKKYHRQNQMTPKEFLHKYVSITWDDYVTVGNDPRSDKSFNQLYVVDGTNHVIEGNPFAFLNVDMQTLMMLAATQIKNDEAVWFSCDISRDVSKNGFMSSDIYNFDYTFDTDLSLTKAERLMMHDSSPNHAMTLTGVDIVDGKPVQWKVENSWGEDRGEKGYYTMSTEWFEKNGYTVVIRKDLLPPELLKSLQQKPVHVPVWDPMYTMSAI